MDWLAFLQGFFGYPSFELSTKVSSFSLTHFGLISRVLPPQTSSIFNKLLAPFGGTTSFSITSFYLAIHDERELPRITRCADKVFGSNPPNGLNRINPLSSM